MIRNLIRAAFAALAGILLAFWSAGSASAASVSSQDATWLVAAHQSNLTEIAAGQAAQKSSSAGIRDLGAMFIKDHTTLDASLKTVAAKYGVSLPSAPNASQQATLKSVAAKSGAAFNSAWLTSQIAGHRATIAATNTELAKGSNADVLKLARTSSPVVARHLNELLALSGKPTSIAAGDGGQAAGMPAGALWAAGLAAGGVLLLGGAARVAVRRRFA
jgi:putative membrane protein